MIDRAPLARLVLHLASGPEVIDFRSATLTVRASVVGLGSRAGPAGGQGPRGWAGEVAVLRPLTRRFGQSAVAAEMTTVDGRGLRGQVHVNTWGGGLLLEGTGPLEGV